MTAQANRMTCAVSPMITKPSNLLGGCGWPKSADGVDLDAVRRVKESDLHTAAAFDVEMSCSPAKEEAVNVVPGSAP